jgi:DNA-binding transcriptional LysR family regulator
MELELRLVRSFLAVAEERHFGRAAARLHLSQPALSRQVQELESRVGARLLDRDSTGVRLTEAGRVLRADGERLIAQGARALDRARRAAAGEIGHLAIGFLGSAADSVLAPLLRALREAHPGIAFTLTERPWTEQTAGLDSGEDDVAFVRDLESATWATYELLEERLCLVLPAGHELAGCAEVDVDELRRVSAEPFVTTPSWMEGREARWGFRPRVLVDLASLQGTFALVAYGFGISLLPESYAAVRRSDVVFVPIAGEVSRQQIAWPPDAPLAARERFLEVVAGAAL